MSVVSWRQDDASSMGAVLAYYTLFSIAPVLIIVIAVAGFFLGAEAASGEIVITTARTARRRRGGRGGGVDRNAEPAAGRTSSRRYPAASRSAPERPPSSPSCRAISTESVRGRQRKRSAAGGRFSAPACCRSGWCSRSRFCCCVDSALSAALAVLGNWWARTVGGWAVLLEAILNFIAHSRSPRDRSR